jgi:amino-acid N-acetyltransferase
MSESLESYAASGPAAKTEPWSPPIDLRSATAADASAILTLVTAHRDEGHLLPRSFDEILRVAHRFVVADRAGLVVGCAELAPLGPALAEIRSLVVDDEARGDGVGRRLVVELTNRARAAGCEQLCAFTHGPAWFCRMGFSLVPHTWLMPKVLTDCMRCPLFRRCGQYAVALAVPAVRMRRTGAGESAA